MGVSSFALLQQALSDGNDRNLFFFLFDLPYLDGWDYRPARLVDRKRVLAALSDWNGSLRYSDHFEGGVDTMRRQACGMGLEGIICKQVDAPYRSGRSRTWLKLKCQGREEFIVLGFTQPAGSRSGLGSLHVGYRNPEGALEYVGGVGTGFTDKELAALRARLDPLMAEAPPDLVYAGEKPETRHHLGTAGAGRGSAVHRLVRIGPHPSRDLSRAARGQTGRRSGARDRRSGRQAGRFLRPTAGDHRASGEAAPRICQTTAC